MQLWLKTTLTIIPKGNYGAGEVTIWDEGTYEPLEQIAGLSNEEILLQGLKKGSLKIVMSGEKLKGEFAIIKMNTAKEENAWLLIKHKDEFAVKHDYDAEDHIKPQKQKIIESQITTSKKQRFQKQKKLNDFIKPMLATKGKEPFNDDKWIFEIKWDGYRAISFLKNENVQIKSRNDKLFNSYLPVFEALKKLNMNAISRKISRHPDRPA